MTKFATYYDYLASRSPLGEIYRKRYVYPKIKTFVQHPALDIGCGIGDLLAFDPQIVGVDINPILVDHVKKAGFVAYTMVPDALPFGDNSFGSAILDNVIEHVEDPSLLLKEISRVVKPKGGLLIGVPGKKGYASDEDHKVFYSESHLISVVERYGFKHEQSLYTPFRSSVLNRFARQYCIHFCLQCT